MKLYYLTEHWKTNKVVDLEHKDAKAIEAERTRVVPDANEMGEVVLEGRAHRSD